MYSVICGPITKNRKYSNYTAVQNIKYSVELSGYNKLVDLPLYDMLRRYLRIHHAISEKVHSRKSVSTGITERLLLRLVLLKFGNRILVFLLSPALCILSCLLFILRSCFVNGISCRSSGPESTFTSSVIALSYWMKNSSRSRKICRENRPYGVQLYVKTCEDAKITNEKILDCIACVM